MIVATIMNTKGRKQILFQEAKMRFRTKLFILCVSAILSLSGFYLISSSFVELHMLADGAETESKAGPSDGCDGNSYESIPIGASK